MSVRIDHTNYEEFYLDYLEGNLSGEALQAFETFLAENPELALDDPSMTVLTPTGEVFDPIEKLALKKGIDMNDLNAETLSFFCIAREEGLLTSEQEQQLNHWLEANAHYRNDAALYAMTTFEADTAQVYENKALLKKETGGRIVPMWFTGVAVAAGLALIITIGLNFGGNGSKNGGAIVADNNLPTTKQHDDSLNSPNVKNSVENPAGTQDLASPRKSAQSTKKIKNDKTPKQPVRQKAPHKYHPYERNILLNENVLASLEKRGAALNEGRKNIEPVHHYTEPASSNPSQNDPSQDLAWVPIDAMKNPIQPVTNTLSNKLNTPVDFRTAKAGKRKGGGFYLKIGKLEVSHQSSSASL